MRTAAGLPRLWFLLWFFHLLAALLLAAPLAAVLYGELGNSRLAGAMAEEFDVMWLLEFFRHSEGLPFTMLALLAAAALVLAGLANVFFAAGAYGVFALPGAPYTPALFFESAGRNFWRFLRLFLTSLFCFAVVLLAGRGVLAAGDKLWGEGMEGAPLQILSTVRTALLFVLGGVVVTIFDQAKARLAYGDSRSALKSALYAARLVLLRAPLRTLGVWGVLALVGAAFYFAFSRASDLLPGAAIAPLVAVLVLQQLYILARIWTRLAVWASQAALYRGLVPTLMPPEELVYVLEPAGGGPPALEAGAEAPLPPHTDEEAAGPA
jgi:hypothetical protein